MPKEKARASPRDTESVASFDSTGKQKSFRRLITRFAEKTSMQGVPYINMAKFWWAKLIWAMLLSLAIVVMVLHLWYLFDQWYSWPKTTKITLGFDNLAFPQVTICNANILHKGRLDKFDGAEKLKDLIDDLKPENFVPDQFDDDFDPYANNGTNLQPNGTQSTPDGTQPPPNGTQSSPNSTQPPPQNGTQPPPQNGTRPPHHNGTQSPPDRNQSLPNGTQSPPNGTQPPRPNIRRKRFVSNYDDVDLTKYDPNYKNYEEDIYSEFSSAMDSQSQIQNIFSELYMNIPKGKRMRLGHQIEDLLIGCTFSGRTCTSSLFQVHQTAEYGNCWTITSNEFTVRRAGPRGGISLILFLETNDYLKGITTGYGARVQFQERNSYPFPYDQGLYISGGMETDIGIKLTSITRLGGNYGTCNDGVEFKQLYNMTYTRRGCQAFCRSTTVITECVCYDDQWEEFAFTKNETLKPCRTDKEKTCKRDIIQQYQAGDLTCTCDNACSETVYVKSISQRQWPTDEYARVLLDWTCSKDSGTCDRLRKMLGDMWKVKNNFLKLNIYYEDLNFENVTEMEQIELQQFLSDVGGAVGLWIGLSILSICEVFQLIIELLAYGAHKTAKGGQQDTGHRGKESKKYEPQSKTRGKDMEDPWSFKGFDPLDRFPRHVREESPYRENDRFSHSSDRGSDDSRRNRRRGNDYDKHGPQIAVPRDHHLDRGHHSDRGSDDSRHERKHDHDSRHSEPRDKPFGYRSGDEYEYERHRRPY